MIIRNGNERYKMIDELVTLAEKFALKKNMIPESYIEGILGPLINDFDDFEYDTVLAVLIKYHNEWLAK